ncbi:transpeptidase family protein [Flavobacteriaceae bacterium]|nr:transpeptidase family protein [Flavobacteriaceae bacterium]MDB9712410.1 transpeptidase family protein [Flavobacteriaceae bacterium]MDC1493105.1 transpeptidase family protein [Flavobacteriaceae bacterium]
MGTTKKNIINRVYIVSVVVFILAISIITKLINIQFVKGNYYIGLSEEENIKNIIIPANRGSVHSSNGKLLATSVPKYDIRFDALAPSNKNFNENINELATSLSEFDEKSTNYWLQKLKNAKEADNRYLLIARNLGYNDYIKVKNFPLFKLGQNRGGFIYDQKTKRDYLLGGVAQRTIGYERKDDFGNVTRPGIDGAFGSKYLKGTDGVRLSQKIGKDKWKPIEDFNQIEPQDGLDIYTTIDIKIQDIAHFALLEQLEKFKADHGSVVVMEVSTGEVKAISNLGRTSKGTYYEKLNYAVGESHEPGSTFKLMGMVAALEDKVIDTSNVIDTGNGVLSFYTRKVRDSKKGGYGKISVAKAFEVSSNTAMVKLINDNYKENPEKFIDRLYRMGLNNTLDLPILGEGIPKITHPSDKKNWNGTTLPWMAFGYGVSLTPLQTLTFYNAIANDGVMLRPRFLKEVKDFNKSVEVFNKEIINPAICSKETAKKVQKMMQNVVEKKHGTAHNIYSPDFSMAGKTGTCQTEYWKESGLYISSFAGYFPVENPKYSCIVVIHKPDKQIGYYGNIVAAPVFKKIAQKIYSETAVVQIIQDFEIAEIKLDYKNEIYTKSINDKTVMPNVTKLSLSDAIALLENLGLVVEVYGKGNKINQSLKSGSKISMNQKVILKLT